MSTPNNGRLPDTSGRSEDRQVGQSDDVRTHDLGGTSKLSTTVIHALADVMEADVSAVSATLYESVDPDALDRVFAEGDETNREGGHVAFVVRGYRVTVYSDGRIVITPPEPGR